ncbi:hypothetical protein BDZ91DRAFT_723857 [Kalaharituber pfeilii]|nr:hypothetical protein BDZ91DRAFT_723857 [Kalaharituber pfeilii]
MARIIPSPPPLPPDVISVNLTRLLSRLDKKLPPIGTDRASTPREAVPNEVERKKIAANLEHARQLLLHLETEYATIKNSAQRKRVQEDLGQRKAKIRRLNERLHIAEQLEAMHEEEEDEALKFAAETKAITTTGSNSSEPTSNVRNRFTQPPEPTATSTATTLNGTAATATGKLSSPKPANPQELEKQLAFHTREQEQITEELLQMSRMLKESSLQFGKHLEDEKPYLDMASQGLDKNVAGMEAMGGRMDRLRNDGKVGWYRSLINMAIIILLGIVGLVILMLPKLRR